MKTKSFLICLIFLVLNIKTYCQEKTHALSFKIAISEEINRSFDQNGRLFIFIDTNPNREPRTQTWPDYRRGIHHLFAKNFSHWQSTKTLFIENSEDWTKTPEWSFTNIPEGTYYIQILWDQNFEGFGINAAGNIYSKKQEVKLTATQTLNFKLSEIIEPFKLVDHELVKLVHHKSDTLSRWWGKPVYERAAILLPSKYYENPGKEYPIRYNVGGGTGPLSRVNSLINDTAFFNWWLSNEAPQIITVYLDGEINGNIYHVDSDNKGPFGYSLINEFIPYIEKLYRGTHSPATRFTDGCSTGGWGSLALQLFYPETFNGAFSYSPDPLSFQKFITVNIYKEENVFYNKYGYLRPIRRNKWGQPVNSFKDWVKLENVLGYSDTYIDSPNQFGVMTSLFGAKGADGKPIPLFDPLTGIIDTLAVGSWKRYDLTNYLENNWDTIGYNLQGKIYICVGYMDNFYLTNGVRIFEDALSKQQNPISDAIIEYHTNWHCWRYSDKRVLEQIAKKLEEKNIK